MNYDGSIRISTKIDETGFNRGTRNMSQTFTRLTASVRRFALGLGIGFLFSAAAIGRFVKSIVREFDIMNSSVGDGVANLRGSFDAFKSALAGTVSTLINQLAPYIIIVVNWLTRLFQILTAIIRVLFGVKTGMAGVGKATSGAASSTGKLAKETEKAGKAAKGALAAFDQIDVLQQDDDKSPSTPDAGGGGIGGLPLPDMGGLEDLENKVRDFLAKMAEFFKPVIDAFGRLVEALKPLGQTIWEGLVWAYENVLVPIAQWRVTDLIPAFLDIFAAAAEVLNEALIALKPLAKDFFENFLKPLGQFVGSAIIAFLTMLRDRLLDLAKWIKENPEKFQSFAKVLGVIAIVIGVVVAALWLFMNASWLVVIAIVAIIAIILNWGKVWEWLKLVVSEVWKDILKGLSNAGASIAAWLINFRNNIINTLAQTGASMAAWARDVREGVTAQFMAMGAGIAGAFVGVVNIIKGMINNIIGAMNTMIRGAVTALNGLIRAANTVGGLLPGFSPLGLVSAPQIPRLAKGAVIPPNAEFMAILGDQKSGKNIEAPENLIRKIISEEIGNIRADIQIEFSGSLSSLVRELNPYIKAENVRIGSSLVTSGVSAK